MRRGIACCTIPRQIQRGTNDFLTIPEAEVRLPLAEYMEGIYSNKEEKGPYNNNVKRMNPVGIVEYAEKVDKEQMNLESVRNTCTRSRSGIQSIQSRFKVIMFTNSKRGQAGEPVRDEELMVYLTNIPVVLNDNGLFFKNNVKYT